MERKGFSQQFLFRPAQVQCSYRWQFIIHWLVPVMSAVGEHNDINESHTTRVFSILKLNLSFEPTTPIIAI